MAANKIIIVCEGGVVQSVFAQNADVEVKVLDWEYDNEEDENKAKKLQKEIDDEDMVEVLYKGK